MLKNILYQLHRQYKRWWQPITLGCRILVIDEGKVLLVRHSYQEGWYLPGGSIERGETLVASAVREVFEECAIRIEEPKLLAMFFSEMEKRSDHIALFLAQIHSKLENRRPDPEIAEFGFFPFEKLPETASPATKRRITEYLTGGARSERW